MIYLARCINAAYGNNDALTLGEYYGITQMTPLAEMPVGYWRMRVYQLIDEFFVSRTDGELHGLSDRFRVESGGGIGGVVAVNSDKVTEAMVIGAEPLYRFEIVQYPYGFDIAIKQARARYNFSGQGARRDSSKGPAGQAGNG